MSLVRAFEGLRPPRDVPNTYIKKTLLRSSVVVKFFPEFCVCTNKPLEGLSSTSVNDEHDQTLHSVEHDSFFSSDMGDDDDLMMGLDTEETSLFLKTESPTYSTIHVVARYTSLLIEDVEFGFNCSVSDVVRIRSDLASDSPEDSLLVSLDSGFLLLIRIWKVPRSFLGVGFSSKKDNIPETFTLHVYKPFVVQWWRQGDRHRPDITGLTLSYHPAGLAIVSTSAQSLFRVYLPLMTDNGLCLRPHFNIPIDGIILHSCFAHPLRTSNADMQILFLTVTFTTEKRLVLTLFSWFVADQLSGNIKRTQLPLSVAHPFPIMVIPLPNIVSFLFVYPHSLEIVSAHNIWSADYSFKSFAFNGLFPTAFHCISKDNLKGSTSQDLTGDEVFLATDSGVIYRILVTENDELECLEFFKIGDSISKFSILPADSAPGYILEYSNDMGGAKRFHISRSLLSVRSTTNSQRTPYSNVHIIKGYKGWSPVLDVVVVALPLRAFLQHQIWGLTGSPKRPKLTQFLRGYLVQKESKCYTDLRKNKQAFRFQIGQRIFIVCTLSAGSKLLEYSPEKLGSKVEGDEPICEIESPFFESNSQTLFCCNLFNRGIMVQYLSNGILLSDFQSSRFESFGNKVLLKVSVADEFVVLVFKSYDIVLLEVFRIADITDFSGPEDKLFFVSLLSQVVDLDFCSMHACILKGSLLVFIGFFSGKIILNSTLLKSSAFQTFNLQLRNEDHISGHIYEACVPHSFVFIEHKQTLFVGTKCGTVCTFGLDENLRALAENSYKLCKSAIDLHLSANDPNFLFVTSTSLWLFDFYSSPAPLPMSFNERVDRTVFSLAELPTCNPHRLEFAFLRDEGLCLGSVFTHPMSLVKEVTTGEGAKKVVFSIDMNLFVVLCQSKDPRNRLIFVDRKLMKVLPHVENGSGSDTDGDSKNTCFEALEMPKCAYFWTVVRQGRVSRKLIVGTESGKTGGLKILDFRRIVSNPKEPIIEMREIYSLSHNQPVSSIVQIGNTILFGSGYWVNSTVYLLEQKRFGEVEQVVKLPSNVTSLDSDGSHVLVNTLEDSVFTFDVLATEQENPAQYIDYIYNDSTQRSLTNHLQLDSRIIAGDKLHSSVVVIETTQPVRNHQLTYQVLFIPRVYKYVPRNHDRFHSRSCNGLPPVLCVGVNGEIIELTIAGDKELYLEKLKERLKAKYKLMLENPITELTERLSRPFEGKVTGKGLQNIYRPFFSYEANKDKVIDLDINELSILDDF